MKEYLSQCAICGKIHSISDKLPDNMDVICDDCRNTIMYMKNYIAMKKFKDSQKGENKDGNI